MAKKSENKEKFCKFAKRVLKCTLVISALLFLVSFIGFGKLINADSYTVWDVVLIILKSIGMAASTIWAIFAVAYLRFEDDYWE